MSRIEHGASIEMAKLEPNFMTLPDPPAVATGDEPIVSSLFCVETSDPFDSYTYRLESIRFSGRTGSPSGWHSIC